MNRQPKYLFYSTLLDAFQDYLNSDKIYSEYWGFSENPPFSEDEFHEKKRLELIDRINRAPMKWEDSEKADRGTAFNEIVDCMIGNRKSEKMQIDRIASPEDNTLCIALRATYNNREFIFPIDICREFAKYYKGAISQVYTESLLPTKYGDVKLYGYIDEMLPFCICDIKTTTSYSAWKYKDYWQKIVYPYCLGETIASFEYNVLLIKEGKTGNAYETFSEQYSYDADRDISLLVKHVENLIDFIEFHRDVITDKKIFNEHEN